MSLSDYGRLMPRVEDLAAAAQAHNLTISEIPPQWKSEPMYNLPPWGEPLVRLPPRTSQ